MALFAVTACALAWLTALPLWLRGQGLSDPLLPLIAAGMMFSPAVATIVTVWFETRGRVPMRAILRRLGMWPLRPLRRTFGVAALAILAMPLLIAAGLAVAGLLGLVRFDLVTFSGFNAQLDALGVPATGRPATSLLVALQLVSIPIGAVFNGIFAFGEEVGWRGWLVPALRPLGLWPSLILSGALWGFWHSPLILLGYNFAEPNLLGVVLMTVACAVLGVLMGWTRLRTGSVWPAVFAHGSLNASAGLAALFVAAGSPTPPAAILGPLGVIMWGVLGVAILVLVLAGQFRTPPLGAPLGPDPVRRQPAAP